jgi:hypothetical protein
VSFNKATTLRPAASDSLLGDGALKVDWMRVTPYSTSGTYTSSVYDAGASVVWQALSFLADLPAGTTATVQVRTAQPDAVTGAPVWSAWQTVASGGLIGAQARYAQYQITLGTSSALATPTVKEIALVFLK